MRLSMGLRAVLAVGMLLAPTWAAPADEEGGDDLHRRYGFDGLILSKYNDGLFGLCAADVNGDGLQDLVFVNNSKAKVEFLLQRREGEELEEESLELVNELPDEVHFRRESLATEQKLWALDMADLDGDGRADAVFTGDSNRLGVVTMGPEGEAVRRLEFEIEKGVQNTSSVHCGDLDGDGRLDVVVLTSDTTDLFLQDEQGVLRAGPRLPNATRGADGFDLADLDGDARLDLLYVVSESEWPLRLRLGQAGGEFGPEMRTRSSAIRSHTVVDVDGDGTSEVVVVGRRSGRASVLHLSRTENASGDEISLSSLRRVPFAALKDAGKRDVALADLDRDGFPDLIAAEPSAARLVVYRGGPGGQFRGADARPSLLGSRQPRVADVDGDGLPEIVLSAPDEGAVAISQVDAEGQVAFPETLGAPGGDLLGLDVGDRDGDGVSETWIVVGEGRGRGREYSLRRFVQGEDSVSFELEDLEADPQDLMLADLDRDGVQDVLLFIPTEPPRILLAGDPFRVVDMEAPGLGILDDVSRSAVWFGDLDGDGADELLVPGSNFVRALYLDERGHAQVVAQYNLEDAGADVTAVTAADLDGDGRLEVLAASPAQGDLVAFGQGRDGPRVVAQADLSGFVPRGLLPADVDGDGRQDIVLWSESAFATVQAGGAEIRFVEGQGYESPVKEAYLDRVAGGDVNGDGAPDLVFTETNKHLMHIAAVTAGAIHHALKFPVYEARLFESSRRSSREPREVIVAEVTGDGLLDVAILVHDRVIVYPQEPAP